VIADFGLSVEHEHGLFDGNKCGTPGYTAPEVFHAIKEDLNSYDHKCDLFSVGVVMY